MNILTESVANYVFFKKSIDNGIDLYMACPQNYRSMNSYVSYLLINKDLQNDIFNSNHIDVYKFNKAKWKKHMLYGPENISEKILELVMNYRRVDFDINYSVMEAIANNPQYFTRVELKSPEEIVKFYTFNLHCPVQVVEKLTSHKPNLDNQTTMDVTKLGNTNIIFDSKVTKKRKEEIINIVTSLKNKLNDINLSKLLYGNVIVTSLETNVFGDYDVEADVIRLSKKSSKSSSNYRVLFHELFHRFLHKYATDEIKAIISNKFYELKNSISMNSFEVGDKIYFSNKIDNKRLKELNADYYIITDYNKRRKYSWSVKAIKDNDIISGFQIPDEFLKVGFINDKQEGNYQDWFPTPYSLQNKDEWICELFSFFCINELPKDPSTFIKEIIK